MKKQITATALGALTAIIGSNAFITHADASTLYTVEKGDCLYSIAREHNTTVNNLRSWNHLVTDVLQIGQELIISQPETNIDSTDTQYSSRVDGLRVRQGPSTQSSIIGSVNKGQTLEVVSQSNGWDKINYNGGTGYVSDNYVVSSTSSTTEDTTDSISEVSNNTDTTPYIVQASALNVRSSGSTKASIIGSLPNNKQIDVISISNGWAKINYHNGIGYVSAKYITQVNTSSETSSSFDVDTFISTALQYEGTPYAWGGSSPSGFDCSGFIYYTLNQSGLDIYRGSSNSYWNDDEYFTHVSNPQPGDLLFLENTYNTSGASHVGIYLGNNEYISAIGNSVQIQRTDSEYTTEHFLGYKRIN